MTVRSIPHFPDFLKTPAMPSYRNRLSGHTPLFVAAMFSLANAAAAQTGAPAEEKETKEPPPLNQFVETWRPAVKGSKKAQPYTPIKKTDDQSHIPEIEMFVGESRVFPTPGVARIAIGNGHILGAASLDDKEVIVFANAVGTSSLFIWNEDGRYQRVKINILPGDISRYAREIAAFLSGIPNARASVIGDKVIVEGDNLADVDIAKIDELAKRYPQIVNFTNRLGWEKMVLMDVKIVEFPRNELRELGIKWTPMGGAGIAGIWGPISRGNTAGYQLNVVTGTDNPAPISASGGGTSVPIPSSLTVLGAINMGLNAQLAMLEENGKATILAEPQLSARNGAEASFLAGGEYPYTVSTIAGTTVMFKPYGVKLDIVPRVDRHGVIRATIKSEVSAIDASISTLAGPALSTRKTNTEFNVRNGETLVLSGLLQRNNSTDIDKVPFLGDIPVLGALFRSKRFQNNETELVVFVTPTIVDSQSPGLVDRVERTKQKLQDNLGHAPYLSDPLQPGHNPAQSNATPPVPEVGVTPRVTATTRDVPAQPPVTALTTTPAVDDRHFRVRATRLTLRLTPDINAPVVAFLPENTRLQALPQPPKGNWLAVQAGTQRGWVDAAWIEPETAGAP